MKNGKKAAPELPSFVLAPTERHPAMIGLLGKDGEGGTVSMLPENKGCDVAWYVNGTWWGVQRKEIADFIASVQDGRLAREIAQMKAAELPIMVVVIEGRVQFTNDGFLMLGQRQTRVTKSQYNSMQWSLMDLGVHVSFTDSAYGTAEYIGGLARWSMKKTHNSMMRRPGPVAPWGKVLNEDWALHLLQSFDGLGLDRARAVLKHFGGVPLDWTVTEAELRQVPGIGKVLAAKMYQALIRVEKPATTGTTVARTRSPRKTTSAAKVSARGAAK